MSHQLLKRVEEFRKQQGLPILTLCKWMDVHNVTFHRWKKAGKITGAYKKLVEDFLVKNQKISFTALDGPSTSPSQNYPSDIAIVGIACYYPGASNVRELWENILARRVQFRRMLDQRLPLSEYYDEDPKAPEKTYLTKAAFLENFQFDWGRLRIPKKTVESTDIAHWLALDIALKTFEDAGYKLSEIPLQNTGVIVGNTLTGEQTRSQTLRLRWPYVQKVLNATLGSLGKGLEERSQIASEMEKIYKSAFYPMTEDSLAGGLANTIAGRICNYLNLKGGGYIVDGACSSSLLAVATAADALKMGNMDLALAGGVDISLDPFELVGFAKAGALAKDQMRVYDQKANGFLPGEGCGFVLLKRLNDAIRDKNYVYAVIKGWGISSDGRGGIMEPSSSGQSFAIGRAYKDLEYKISDVDFVEGHGTGTTKGDRVELEGIASAIDKTIRKGDVNKRRCGVTSFKSIVGHTKAAAGVGGLIKAILAVNQRILPPTASCTHPNEVFKDKAKNLYPLIHGEKLPNDRIVRAGISSAGFGGINCHVTVESKDGPKEGLKPKLDENALFVSQQDTEIFVFTSRSIIHLEKIIQKFKEDLRNISIAEMADLAAFLNKKVKDRLPIKAAIVTHSPEHLYEALVSIEQEIQNVQLEEGKVHRIKSADPSTNILLSNGVKNCRIGYLYPGQGSQRFNMARRVVERYKWAKDLFKLSNLPLFKSIFVVAEKFSSKEELQEIDKQLSDTRITQPAVVLSSLIWTEFLSKLGIEPHACIGHSLGELTAFYKGRAFDKETLIKFAQFRGELMRSDNRLSGSMVSLFCSKDKAEALINKISGNIVVANINSPNQIVVSGGKKEIEKAVEIARKENIPAYPLNVSNAFHSSFMKEASDKIKRTKILPERFKSNEIKVYSCITGGAVNDAVDLKEYFSKQVISPVDFVGAIRSASEECDLMIEVGPGKVLTDLVKAINDKILCLPIESYSGNDRDLNIVLAELFVRNVPVKWEELYRNRLIKVFVPASRKKFIENQCEHPLKIGKQFLQNKLLPVLLQVKEETEQLEEIIPGGLPEVKGKDHIADLLIKLTQEITGFDRESISLNLRLLDDLNLDSIKAAELIGKVARALGIPGQVDPSQLSNNTLEQICDHLYVLSTQTRAGATQESLNDILKRYHGQTWVRNFTPELRSEEIRTKNVNQLKDLKSIFLLSEKSEMNLIHEIKDELKNLKVKAQKIYIGEFNEKQEKTGRIDCLIAVLPKNLFSHHPGSSYCHSRKSGNPYKEFNKDSLKDMIKRLQTVSELANSKYLDKDSFVVFVQFGGGATAIASTLYLERPDLKVRVMDFDEKTNEGIIADKIIDELQTYDPFSSVVYDTQLNRQVIYYENSQPLDYKKRKINWSKKDIVLVSGGAKGITAQCALEFARATNACMVLIGRSPAPKNLKDETNEIVQTLRQFEKEGLKCKYYRCDVADENDVFSTIEEIENTLGEITGIIHGAGLNSLKRLKQASTQEVFQEALPKVMGAVHICNALKSHPPKLIAGITSIIGLTGMEASGWYGFSNEILNLFLHHRFSGISDHNSHVISAKAGIQKPEVVTIAYSVWDEVGMGARLGSINRLAEKGIGAIPVAEGVKRFNQLTEGDPGTQQVIVAARVAGIGTWRSSELKANHFRFLEKIEYILPGIEIIARANLNVEDDPYLLDHNWKGSLLFPFVFGFEAMAQAVAYVLGIEKFDHINAKDIDLQRPISVPQESGTTIEIHAQVLEQEKSNGVRQVKVEIYSQETDYKEPHFSAIFELGPNSNDVEKSNLNIQQKAKKVIDLDMQTDIYGPILFQGKLFQCIEQIHELYYDKEKNKGECFFTSAYNKSAEDFLNKNKKFNKRFLIGDPFFIDTMLQSMQVIIPQDISLPRDIENIRLNFGQKISNSNYVSQSVIKRLDVNFYRGDAQIVLQDDLYLEIKNCRLKVLSNDLSNPSANDLVNPSKRDQKTIENKLAELSNELGFVPPVVKCAYDAKLKNALKEIRHKIEKPLIKSAVEELFKRDKRVNVNIKIKWLKSGKPIIEGKGVNDVGISISHIGSFIIVVAGYGGQGCDIETSIDRDRSKWLLLLGREKIELVDKITNFIDSRNINLAGMAVWGTSEILKKVQNQQLNNFEVSIHNKVITVFTNPKDKNNLIVSFNILLSDGIKNQFSILVHRKEEDFDSKIQLNKFNVKDDLFSFNMDYSGPQEQVVFTKRFPVTFRASQMLSKKVYFTNYFEWMGEVREYTGLAIFREIYKMSGIGGWGMATNYTNLEILGEVEPGDTIEVRIWQESSANEILNLKYDWRKIDSDGMRSRIAFSQMGFSWLKILGHGLAKVESLPSILKEFFDGMLPRSNSLKPLEILPSQYKAFSLGEIIFKNQNLLKNRTPVFSHEVLTSTENSNFIGNIYFANYGEWLGQVRDLFLYRLNSDYFGNFGKDGEWACLNCSIDHLSEAMPYDNILIRMYIDTIYKSGLDFSFDYYLLDGKKIKRKLAIAKQKVVLIKRNSNNNPIVLDLPKIFIQNLQTNFDAKFK